MTLTDRPAPGYTPPAVTARRPVADPLIALPELSDPGATPSAHFERSPNGRSRNAARIGHMAHTDRPAAVYTPPAIAARHTVAGLLAPDGVKSDPGVVISAHFEK